MKRLLALTAAACLIAAPLSFAQAPVQPQTPPETAQPAPPPPATPAPIPPQPAAPNAPAATPSASDAAEGAPRCRTRREAGEQCSCLSAPTDFGTSAPAENGSHNMCVAPES